MQVYFAGTIVGDRRHLRVYQSIVEHVQSAGHAVPTAHVAREDVLTEESIHTPRQVYDRDVAWIRGCDCLVAEVSAPSLGVGYEVCYALGRGKPVLCLHRRGTALSKMISGCTEPGMSMRDYDDVRDALTQVDVFLTEIEQQKR
jgi:nucleoside 2-deoxyribosyltransferase